MKVRPQDPGELFIFLHTVNSTPPGGEIRLSDQDAIDRLLRRGAICTKAELRGMHERERQRLGF